MIMCSEKGWQMNTSARRTNGALICGAFVLGLLLGGCTSPAEPQSSASPTPVSSPAKPSSPSASATSVSPSPPSLNPDYTLTINIVISKGKTVPNGEKINVRVGQKVILNVTSDTDDEIHAHIGGDGYQLAVPAGRPTKGSFTLESPGSFEVESHHLEKIIVILNAR
jgi:heme/copper-type cytochrome/quinol oxidase subunit 2